ncbi:MAG TPA: hypothetical protein VGJ51_06065 [Candidatus Angelobacter sp.]|jgi:hypothetical protein
MKLRIKILFMLSGTFFCAFLFFITDRGQEILRGRMPPDATGFQRDDIYMGAGLAPWVWMLTPAFILMLLALVMRRASKNVSDLKRQ